MSILLLLVAAATAWRTGLFPVSPRAAALTRGGARMPSVGAAEQRAAVRRIAALGHPVFCGGGTKPLVALTFDDGPGPYTPRTLAILRAHHAHATFFLVGKEIDAWPSLVGIPRRERAAGAVGDHTFDHVPLVRLTAGALSHEVVDARAAIASASGGPVALFRPPLGRHDATLDALLLRLGMVEVLWSVDSGDSTGATGPEVLANVEAGLRPGAIVILHENRGTTLRQLPAILRAVRERGLWAVSVPELLALDPPSPAQLRAGSCP